MNKVRLGFVGGGRDAFIGEVHRKAALLDHECEIVAGALSSDAERAKESGRAWGLDEERAYASYQEMFSRESQRDLSSRMQAVAIVTPNHLHFPVAHAALHAGFHVICDKPLCLNATEAASLRTIAVEKQRCFAVTYHYSGYPMIRLARQLVAEGRLGEIRKVVVDYAQGWLSQPIEADGQKQAAWRTDPAKAGASCCMGDIGTHAFQLSEFVTGERVSRVCAQLTTFVPGRALDDDGSVLMQFASGATGVLTASQISTGKENALRLRISGTLATLEWDHEDCNSLTLFESDGSRRVYRSGAGGPAGDWSRFPPGHPEGFLEAFANVYRAFARDVVTVENTTIARTDWRARDCDYPTLTDGTRGVQFVEAVVQSSQSDKKWQDIEQI